MSPTITIRPARFIMFLVAVTGILLIAHLGVTYAKYALGLKYFYGIIPMFDLDAERNLPTAFSAGLLLLVAGLFCMVSKGARQSGERYGIWIFLSALFVFLAADEFCSIHELVGRPIRLTYRPSGFLFFAWVIPYGIAVAILSIFVLPTIWRLPSRIRFTLGASAAVYLAGAMGLEMIAGRRLEMLDRQKDIGFAMLATCEETLEMAGLMIAAYALLRLLQSTYGGCVIALEAQHPEATEAVLRLRKAA